VVRDVGLVKLLSIPELETRGKMHDLLLTDLDASRISLLQDIAHPRSTRKPTIDPYSIRVHWPKLPARYFIYGPTLDLVNALREKRIVKVCWDCGQLYGPHNTQYHRQIQRFCSRKCERRAWARHDYWNKKTQEKEDQQHSTANKHTL